MADDVDSKIAVTKAPRLYGARDVHDSPPSMYLLDDYCLKRVLDYLPGRFRFVAGVDRRFLRLYPYGTATRYVNIVESIPTTSVWLHERNEEDEEDEPRCICAAIRNDELDSLSWLLSQEQITFGSYGGIVSAASWGQLRIMKWFRSRDPTCEVDEKACNIAAEQGHLEIVEWLRSQDPPFPWGPSTCALAAGHGHLDVVQWLRSQDPPCPWDELTCVFAVAAGRLPMVEWLRSQDPPCPWGLDTIANAVSNNRLEMVQWLR